MFRCRFDRASPETGSRISACTRLAGLFCPYLLKLMPSFKWSSARRWSFHCAYDVEHDVALEVAQGFNTQLNFFFFVPLFNLRPYYFACSFLSHLSEFNVLSVRVKPEAQSWLPSTL